MQTGTRLAGRSLLALVALSLAFAQDRPEEKPTAEPPSPLFFRIGSAEFTPGGFMDFTSIWRSTNVGSGIGTSFGSIPFGNTPAGHLSETRFSAQNSRLTLKVSATHGKQSITGYVEADFLGALPPNGAVTSNSNSLRMRVFWANIRTGKWEFLGGQDWSLLTPNRTGISPYTSDVFYSSVVDTNYQVGLTWSRDPQFRAVYHASKHWTAAVSLENPQQYVGPAVTFPSSFYAGQFDNGSNPGAPNQRPDVIAKVAFDARPGGRAVHLEAAGLSRAFRVVNPQFKTSATQGYGGSLNGNLELFRDFHFVFTSFVSEGGGRYIFGLGPDVVVGPDGSLSPVRAASGIAGFEYNVTPSWSVYGYYGGAYFWRNFTETAPGQFVGFGFPGSPSSANRSVQEPSFGIIHTFWKKPEYGAVQLLTQYSYVTRSPWSVPAGAPANARTNMVYVNLRYVLP